MTGSHGHSESERAGAALHTGAPPLIRGVHRGRMAPPRPPLWGCCCLQSHHPIISSLHYPSIIHSFILPHPQPSHHIHKDTLVNLRQRPQFILINSHEFNDFFFQLIWPRFSKTLLFLASLLRFRLTTFSIIHTFKLTFYIFDEPFMPTFQLRCSNVQSFSYFDIICLNCWKQKFFLFLFSCFIKEAFIFLKP